MTLVNDRNNRGIGAPLISEIAQFAYPKSDLNDTTCTMGKIPHTPGRVNNHEIGNTE
jgi:hypothetical protein